MDSGISNMLNGVLSNPEALNKIMSVMPAVSQMLNNSSGENPAEPINSSSSSSSIEDLMANAEVSAALKNLITALNFQNNQNNQNTAAIPAVSNIAEDFSGDDNNNNSTIEKTLDTLKNFSSATSPESDHRLKLLLALKPFLKDGRKTKIDHAIKYMNAAKIINIFGKNGFV